MSIVSIEGITLGSDYQGVSKLLKAPSRVQRILDDQLTEYEFEGGLAITVDSKNVILEVQGSELRVEGKGTCFKGMSYEEVVEVLGPPGSSRSGDYYTMISELQSAKSAFYSVRRRITLRCV